ncbi:Maf family protein [Desulfocastanea catecholica]
MYHNQDKIILASGSPRRREYLQEMGIRFTVRTAAVDEQPFDQESPQDFVLRMAREKAAVVSADFSDYWVISGDTIVCLGDKILGKPADEREAVALLMNLAGREHCVKTGFCVSHRARGVQIVRLVTTRVFFADFSEAVARAYVAAGESLDKAGAYGIQGRGIFLVKSIEGSYSNVVGLPLYELIEVLLANGVIAPGSPGCLDA